MDDSDIPLDRRTKQSQDAQIMIKMLINEIDKVKKLEELSAKTKNLKLNKEEANIVHNSVSFDYNDEEGRFAVAKADIKIGEKILVQEPHCAMLLEKYSKTNCQHCFKRYYRHKFQ